MELSKENRAGEQQQVTDTAAGKSKLYHTSDIKCLHAHSVAQELEVY